jgi:dTDP-4-amino-4,6-dideoxygalactose transaminase
MRIGRQTVSLPILPKLSEEVVEDVIRSVKEILSVNVVR